MNLGKSFESRTIGGTRSSHIAFFTRRGWARLISESIQLRIKNWEAIVVANGIELN